MSSTSRDVLAELLRKNLAGEPWHGPGTLDLLRDLDHRQAIARPFAGAHSIWALVLHMTAWHGEVRRRLAGATPAMPAEGDWPEPPPASPEAWRHAVQALSSSLEEVCEAIAALSEADLDRKIGTLERPLGTGVTLREMLVGLLQHDTYHSGQIALLKKAI